MVQNFIVGVIMKIILLTIILYSTITTILFVLSEFFNAFDEETLLMIICGPVLWVFNFIVYLIYFIKYKKIYYTESSYQRFLKVNWPMYRFGNILLIRNKAKGLSYWSLKKIVPDEKKKKWLIKKKRRLICLLF